MLIAHWAEITDEQRRAAVQNVPDLATMGLDPPAALIEAGLAPVAPRGIGPFFAQKRTNEFYTRLALDFVSDIASLLKTPVNIGFTVTAKVGLTEKTTSGMDTAALNAFGEAGDGPMAKCVITVSPTADAYDLPELNSSMAHEVWHCFEGAVLGVKRYNSDNPAPWITEGEADWVGYTLAPTGAVGPWSWPRYLTKPEKALFTRAYDGMGFFSQLDQATTDPWAIMVPTLEAATNEDAYVAAHGDRSQFLDLWAPGYLRDASPKRGDAWEITGPRNYDGSRQARQARADQRRHDPDFGRCVHERDRRLRHRARLHDGVVLRDTPASPMAAATTT